MRKSKKQKAEKTKAPFMVRQGDVLVFAGTKPPAITTEVPRENGAVVLAHGEVTGHTHAIREPGVCMLRAEGLGDRWLNVSVTSLLQHEEHGTIELPGGGETLTVRIQREWQGGVSRRVED